jgi:hypothetical protein
LLRTGTGTTEPMPLTVALPDSSLPSHSTPDKRRGMLVPVGGGGLQPVANLIAALRVLTSEGPPLQNALHGFGPVEPASA